jgi:hypothetical protein
MELKIVLADKRSRAHTPYISSSWLRLLTEANIVLKYSDLILNLETGFDAGIRVISSTYAPPNSSTLDKFPSEFASIIDKEYARGRHIGPLSQRQVEDLIGPFQSSPLSLVPKPGKSTLRLVQNLSFPSKPTRGVHSINSTIDSDMYPCTWGTFPTICLLISRLPPGSQAAVRDVAEAHRTIPVRPSQWPGLVVRLPGIDLFNIDTCSCFGLSSAAGNHGKIGDAGAELMRAQGITPISKWSDDHIFFRIPRHSIPAYNALRHLWHSSITANGGRLHTGGRYWYRGETMPDGNPEEFDEDASFPVRDLSGSSPRSEEDSSFSFCMADIDRLSAELGIPWETTKDIPFSFEVPFIGFLWNLPALTVSIPERKKSKYLAAIASWESSPTHTLEEVQKLYGKLLHSSLIVPVGRAYLTNLEAMLGIFHDSPFKPRSPPRGTAEDLGWWKLTLSLPSVSRPIPGPHPLADPSAFSDASSGIGIAITIGPFWRAWSLIPGWKRDGRDIGWAEAIAFELLVQHVVSSAPGGSHLKVFSDNVGVVEGWWKGRSRNPQVNKVFRRIHSACASSNCTIHTRHVRSEANPANDPSRGSYPPLSLLLPPSPIPVELLPFIRDFDAPPKQGSPRGNPPTPSLPKVTPKAPLNAPPIPVFDLGSLSEQGCCD